MQRPPPSQRGSESIPATQNAPPAVIPDIPPILFVPFTNLIGFTQMPLMIWDFFNQRHKVRSGSEAAYRLVMKQTRPIIPPTSSPLTGLQGPDAAAAETSDQQGDDLDFDKDVESYFKSSLSSTITDIEKRRREYYASLPAKLETARALSRGTREPTKDEVSAPPPTEVELRAERMKKELRWRGDIEGWELIWRDKGVVWDDRFASSMRVFEDPTMEGEADPFSSKFD